MNKNAFTVLATGSLALLLNVTDAEASSYTAKSGDSLWKIAASNKISVTDLKKWNGLTSDALSVNQILTLTSPSSAKPVHAAQDNKSSQASRQATATYTVKSGDTLSHIARLHKITVNEIQKMNNLTIYHVFPGQQLKVGGVAPAAKPSPVSAPPTVIASTTYKIVKGDTISGIAVRHGISTAQLMEWNNLTSSAIRVGQILKLKAPTTALSKPVLSPKPTTVPATAPKQAAASYTVVKGDTLSSIASRYNISVTQLMNLNNMTSSNIRVGQALTVKTGISPAKPAAKPTSVPTSAPAQVQGSYKVAIGDTLTAIAVRHGISVTQLMNWNQLSSTNIRVGQVLKVENTLVSPQSPNAPVLVPAPAGTGTRSQVVSLGLSLVGTPYVWGGSSLSGFDCSGFIYYVYNQAGVKIPRTNAVGFEARSYEVDVPQIGDFVFFSNTYKPGISHMGIYVGDNKFVHAGGDQVQITDLNDVYWGKHFDSFQRLYALN